MDQTAMAAIKAIACPQKFDLSENGRLLAVHGLAEETVDHIAAELDRILAESADSPQHAHWLQQEHSWGQQLWSMLKQDFPGNLEGYEYIS